LGERSTIIGQRGRVVRRGAGVVLELVDLLDDLVEDAGHELVHRLGVVAFDEVRRPAAAPQELVQLLGLDAGQHGRVG
jgi:hypothetical protein